MPLIMAAAHGGTNVRGKHQTNVFVLLLITSLILVVLGAGMWFVYLAIDLATGNGQFWACHRANCYWASANERGLYALFAAATALGCFFMSAILYRVASKGWDERFRMRALAFSDAEDKR